MEGKQMAQTDWAMWGALGQWVGAAGQAVTALLALLIALMTYRYTKRQNTITLIKYLNDMVNDFNKAVIGSEAAQHVVSGLRQPIVNQPDDSIVFLYLNFLHTSFRMAAAGLIESGLSDATMANGVHYLIKLKRDEIERFLSRGYEPAFRAAVLKSYDSLVK
jgi:hypothetical protein